ncbi:major facilitator superfamily domain protein [Fusarium sp. NRRL 52700]|nr:major facilitator superfamily domain protein [Fusarium sp. NRRL 52700]
MAASSNLGGFATLRFLLRAAESIQLAAFFIITQVLCAGLSSQPQVPTANHHQHVLAGFGTKAGNLLNSIGLVRSLNFDLARMPRHQRFWLHTLTNRPSAGPYQCIEIIRLIVFCTLASRIRNSRLALTILANALALVGISMLYAFDVHQRWKLMAGLWAMLAFITCSFLLGMGTISENIAGHTKKVTAQAIIFTCYCCGCIIGPQLCTTPPYKQGIRTNIVALVVSWFVGVVYIHFENRKRKAFLDENIHLLNEDNYHFRDLADKQNHFILNVLGRMDYKDVLVK